MTSEISDEDFSWRPGQRTKKPKTGEKRKHEKQKLDDSFDPFFAPDDAPFERVSG